MAFLLMANSQAKQMAVSLAEESPAVRQSLGDPLKTGWFVTGEISVNEASGHAELAIPLSGPKGKGKLFVEAEKHADIWGMNLLVFVPENGERVDLLAEQATKAGAGSR